MIACLQRQADKNISGGGEGLAKMNPRRRRTGLMPSYSGPTSSYSYYPSYYSTPFFSSGYSGGYSSYYSRGSSYSSGSTAPSSYSAGNDCSRLSREAVRDLQASRTRYRGSKTDTELTLGDTGCLVCTNII